jgi:hypothetical protein
MMMNRTGGLSSESAQRELAKLKKLLKIRDELNVRIPQTVLDISILPIQQKAVQDKIAEIVNYLQRWNVPIESAWN